jgi:hypothetical protein
MDSIGKSLFPSIGIGKMLQETKRFLASVHEVHVHDVEPLHNAQYHLLALSVHTHPVGSDDVVAEKL